MRVNPSTDTVRAAFVPLMNDPSFAESRKLLEKGLPIAEMLQAMAAHPDLLASFSEFGKFVYPGGLLERPLKERVILKASLMNECQFCTESHTALMKNLGISSDPQSELKREVSRLPERDQLALEYTEYVTTRSNEVPESLFSQLRACFSEAEIVELTFLIGFINMLNRFNNALGVRYHGDYSKGH